MILQRMGGGYIGPMKNIYRKFAVRYSKLSFGGDVLTIDYRVAPEYPYPAALEDAVYAYKWLIQEKEYEPDHIIIAGDSAGGGLALALVMYLRDHRLAMPGGIITMSPWTDLTNSGASYTDNYETDPLFGNSTDNMLFIPPISERLIRRSRICRRCLGIITGFRRCSCRWEAMRCRLSDTLGGMRRNWKRARVPPFICLRGMFHVFQMGWDLTRRAGEAWEEVEEFLRITCGISRKPDGKVVKRGQDAGERKPRPRWQAGAGIDEEEPAG